MNDFNKAWEVIARNGRALNDIILTIEDENQIKKVRSLIDQERKLTVGSPDASKAVMRTYNGGAMYKLDCDYDHTGLEFCLLLKKES